MSLQYDGKGTVLEFHGEGTNRIYPTITRWHYRGWKTYRQVIESYIQKGYVRKVPDQEQSNSKWILPHFPVSRPDKDATKTRIVFDASAK